MVIMQNKETNETKRVLKTFHIGNFLGFPFIAIIVFVFYVLLTAGVPVTPGKGFVSMAVILGLLYVWERVSYNDKKQIEQLRDAGFAVVKEEDSKESYSNSVDKKVVKKSVYNNMLEKKYNNQTSTSPTAIPTNSHGKKLSGSALFTVGFMVFIAIVVAGSKSTNSNTTYNNHKYSNPHEAMISEAIKLGKETLRKNRKLDEMYKLRDYNKLTKMTRLKTVTVDETLNYNDIGIENPNVHNISAFESSNSTCINSFKQAANDDPMLYAYSFDNNLKPTLWIDNVRRVWYGGHNGNLAIINLDFYGFNKSYANSMKKKGCSGLVFKGVYTKPGVKTTFNGKRVLFRSFDIPTYYDGTFGRYISPVLDYNGVLVD